MLWVSQVTAGRKNGLRYEIAGSECALAWNSEQPNELWVGHRDRPNETIMRDPALLGDKDDTPAEDTFRFPGGLEDYLVHTLAGTDFFGDAPFAGRVDFREKGSTWTWAPEPKAPPRRSVIL